MKKIDNFTNMYSVSKTLRFKAIPVGKTQENLDKKRLIEEDEERAKRYKEAKKLIDRYHVYFINDVLSKTEIVGLDEYEVLYLKTDKTDAEKERMIGLEDNFRKQIVRMFRSDKRFATIFKETLLDVLANEFLSEKEDIDTILSFKKFYTAFAGFNENRQNLYSEEAKATAIAYRAINENLSRYISNTKSFEKIYKSLGDDIIAKINREMNLDPYSVEDLFKIEFYNFLLCEEGIQLYNTFLGGYINDEGVKVQGLNEYINLFNQQLPKSEKNKRLPKLQILYKQLLADRTSMSFYESGYENDQEVIDSVVSISNMDSSVILAVKNLQGIVDSLCDMNGEGIYIKNGPALTMLSKELTGDWSSFSRFWNEQYDSINMKKIPKDMDKYEEKRRKAYKSIDSFMLSEIDCTLKDVIEHTSLELLSEKITEAIQSIFNQNGNVIALGQEPYPQDKSLCGDDETIAIIKNYLDSIKQLESLLIPLLGTGKETERNEIFYGEIVEIVDSIRQVDKIYDFVRNYVTKKPFSTDKVKLYFQNPQLLGGWDRNKVPDYRTTILRKDGLYYLLIIDKDNSKILEGLSEGNADSYELIDYKLIPGASKQLPHAFFSGKGIALYNPTNEVLDIYNSGAFKKGDNFSKKACHSIIDYYKHAIGLSEWQNEYNFSFSDTESYEDISGFFREVDQQGYKLSFTKVDKNSIDSLVDEGKVYLFQLYNKDFSPYSHGTENLHTMIFKQVFNEDNHGTIKLCGGAELFFRRASIKKDNRVIHKANQTLKNKNPLNPKRESTFTYDLVKDKRYTVDQYELHIPVTLNRTPNGNYKLNDAVRRLLVADDNPYIIGIDRGERNLVYICVIDGKGNIVEQTSLNEIINEHDRVKSVTDYHMLLDYKEKERARARQEWTSVENIKELKEGYISQIVHKICELVIKYDAVIAMEDLNSGFKNSRIKVEKQVYQKFEKALIDKLNYLTDKKVEIDRPGSVVNGLQLTNKFESFRSMGTQNGFIFYIPAWLTSKIDPATGFVDLLKPKYVSIEASRELIGNLEEISYDSKLDMFKFVLDYTKFQRTDADYKKKWILYSNGSRIYSYRNPEHNNEWDYKDIHLTDAFKELFEKYEIAISTNDMRNDLVSQNEKAFFMEFIHLLRLTLQMRNSISGSVDVDYLISPVCDSKGVFYDSRTCCDSLPKDADANGAYNIARKVLWAINKMKETQDEVGKVKINISNKDWLEFAQK